MELELQKEEFDCFQPCPVLIATREETLETIVPDHCPDVARVVDAGACFLLRSYAAADGKVTAAGTVKLTLLYLTDDVQGIQTMEYAIPFEHSLDGNVPTECAAASVEGCVGNVEVRLLNPRTLFTRLDIEWKALPYVHTTLTTCGAISEQSKYAIETLCETREVSLIRAVSEKEFVFSEELTLPGGREPIRELLSQRVKLRVTEAKCVGNKVILKGLACVSLLYNAENGSPCAYAEELPFSQILEGMAEEGGDPSASLVLNLSDYEIYEASDDGRTVGIKLFMNVFLVLRQTKSVCCITDLYSTAYDLDVQSVSVPLWRVPEYVSATQSVREQLDTGTEVRSVLSTDVGFGSVSVRQSEGQASLRVSANLTVLYLDEAGVPYTAARRIEITADAEVNGDAQADVESVCAGDIAANINANGIELRFPAEFRIVSLSAPACVCLTHVSAEEPGERDVEAPSLVLRSLNEGQRLWDVAKQYHTTVEEILSANELTDDAALDPGRMLLIPRKR